MSSNNTGLLATLSGKITGPLQTAFWTAIILAAVFLLLFILLLVAAFKKSNHCLTPMNGMMVGERKGPSTFVKVMLIIAALVFAAQMALAIFFAVYVGGLISKVDNAFTRSALFKLVGSKILNAISGRTAVNESGDFVLETAAQATTPAP